MRKSIFVISSIIGALCILLFSPQSPLDVRVTRDDGRREEQTGAGPAVNADQRSTSCVTPDAASAERCKDMEASILDVTLRLELAVKNLGDKGSGKPITVIIAHATVVGGRFLVTHNHFAISPDEHNDSQLLTLSAYHADGTPAVHQAPAHTFRVFSAGEQTLVFDFGQYGGQGAFDYMRMASAQMGTWQGLGLRPGMEVAQVDWDGQTTHVDWVRVSGIELDTGIPALQLENYVAPGASGGGVFYAGHHIGNNWFRRVYRQASTAEIVGKRTVAALNETSLIPLVARATIPAQGANATLSARNLPLYLAPTDVILR